MADARKEANGKKKAEINTTVSTKATLVSFPLVLEQNGGCYSESVLIQGQ